MTQFSITRSNIGDLSVGRGVLIDLTAATTAVFDISPQNAETTPEIPEVTANRAAPRFAGGSSRNMVIETFINSDIPSGWFKQIEKYKWASEDGGFLVTIGDDGSLEWSDATDVIMTAQGGSIPLDDRIVCSSFVGSGGIGNAEYIVDLGTATGVVQLDFNAYTIPDIFIVEYDGVEVINTGYRGVSGTYDGIPITVSGPAIGSATFTKTTSSPTFCVVKVTAPFTGTSWELSLSCPGGASPPYPIATPGRTTFTAYSTPYGETLNGSTPFTLDVTYEGGETETVIQVSSESLDPVSGLFDLTEAAVTRWQGTNFRIDIDELGEATISDNADVIAIRPTVAGFEQYLDPSGSYEATAYGRDTYNNSVEFFVSINMVITPPLELYTFLKLNVSAGSITSIAGPYSAPTLPANGPGLQYIPISYSDGAGRVTQFYESAILWR